MNEALWQRVDESLDARRDPLQDPRLARELAADPEALAEVRRLMRRLSAVRRPASAEPARSRRRAGVLAAAAVVAVCAGLLIAAERGDRSRAYHPPVSSAAPAVSLVVERTTPEPARYERVVLEPRHVIAWTLEGNRP